ncbi:MAG: N-acetylmuramoyl-L-alanine amidase, partial [Bacteroidota bacterium]
MIWLFFGLEAQAQTRVKAVSGDGIYSLLRRYDIPLSSATINEFIALNKDYIGDNRKIYAGREYWLPQFEVTPRDSIQEASSGEGSLKEATEADTTDRHVKVITPIVKKTVEEQSERSLSPESPSPVSTKGERSIVNSSATKDSVSKSLSDKSVYAGRFPIFGKDHELVLRKDNVLAGCYYYLISGHGGPDPGAVGTISNKKVAEDEYAYDVTLRLARHLISRGAVVYLITRDPD